LNTFFNANLLDSIASLSFEWPWAALLLPLPILLSVLWPKKHRPTEQSPAPQIPAYISANYSIGIARTGGMAKSKQSTLFYLLLWALLCVSVMRPEFVGEKVELPMDGRDLMLAIDISPSMKELDMPLNGDRATRLDVVKYVVSEFVQERKGDRIGLILFGSQPYIQAPLTFDTKTVNTLLQEAFLGMAGDATAIGDAIALGVKRLREQAEQSRVLILMSDGANTAGEIPPEKAAQLAATQNIKVYTIGIGADEMLQRSFFGTRRINPSADLDEDMLRTIADTTGGQYYRARNTEELNKIYEEISQLEPIELETRSYQPSKALSYVFAGVAIVLYLLRITLNFTLNQLRTRLWNAQSEEPNTSPSSTTKETN
jgi:Ca-activated chloride channel homolog